jgi:NADPH:quinone reductase-like Zn-dependent oxidoreductase
MPLIVRMHQQGGPDVLTLEDITLPAPAAGEVKVRIEAIGLNRSEALFRSGRYPIKPLLPCFVGYEAAGVVDAVGPGVSGFSAGDPVCVLPNFRLGDYGVYGEQAIVPASSLVATPPGLSPAQAAAVWMQYFTAWAIVEAGKAGVGDAVLIPAASSSVGVAAIQIANWVGATPIALTRTSAKADALRAQGARHVVATTEVDLAKEVMRITGGRGAQVAFDPVGGPYVGTLADAMGEDGTIIIYGSLSGEATPYPHWPAAMKSLSLRGWVASYIWSHPQRFERVSRLIRQGLAEGHLKPVIAKTFPLREIAAAHAYLESNAQVGKVVVTV